MASDYALRILMLLSQSDTTITVDEITEKLNISKSHVMKIVAKLSQQNYLKTNRGRIGGIALSMPPENIKLGDIVQIIEADFAVVECLKSTKCNCYFLPNCALTSIMKGATKAFVEHLNKFTLQTIIEKAEA